MEQHDHGDLAALLPEDLLADVLRRVATPRWLAIARCVCKAWRAIVDGERLLCTDLHFSGMFIYYDVLPFPEFFSRPPSPGRPRISGKLDFLPPDNKVHSDDDEYYIRDNCNGLLLASIYLSNNPTMQNYLVVVNPATRRWDILPSPPNQPTTGTTVRGADIHEYYLAFDPTVSSYYQVFRIPYLSSRLKPGDEFDPLEEASEWPPSPYILHVFSSRTRRWDERSFVRDGDAAGTVAKMREGLGYERHFSAYWRGSLYVQCQTNFVMRISLSQDNYIVIRPPRNIGECPYMGRSKKGVYFASFVTSFVTGFIRIFILNESCDQTKWVFKHDYDLEPVKEFGQRLHGHWILEDINYDIFHSNLSEVKKKEVVLQETFEWNSDNDDFEDNGYMVEARPYRCSGIDILGFHPYKEILFLCESGTCKLNATGFAYHLNNFKVESLGSIYPMVYGDFDSALPNERREIVGFPYTPCYWIEDIPEKVN